MKTELRVIGVLLAATVAAMAEMRSWTLEKSGKTVQGEVAGFTDNAVTLREAGGKVVSLPIAYLSQKDRAYVAAEQTKQWKEVEVVKLDASTAVGLYKKCTVRSADVKGDLYIERLPASVLGVLQQRNKQAAPIAELSAQIEAQKHAVQDAKAAIPDKRGKPHAERHALARERGQVNAELSNVNAREAELAKLQKAYDDSVQKTRNQTMVTMRNTGITYKNLPLWQCFDTRKPK
jgi:hypothetical protein